MDLLFKFKQDIGAGVGGVAQAGASVIDTEATNAANLRLQQNANQFNAQQANVQRTWSGQQAQKQMDFNAAQAQKTRQFQDTERVASQNYNTEMSNTQIQRRMADLKAAGVNPLLAASQLGGASSPVSTPMSGATAQAGLPSGASAQAAGTAHVSGAMQNIANLALTSAQAVNTEQNTKYQYQQTRGAEFKADQLAVDTSQEMLMKRAEWMANNYQMSTDQAAIVAQTRQLIVKQTEGQDLANVSQMIHNNIDRLDYKGQQALYSEMVATQLAVMDQEKTEATNVAAVQKGQATPYGKAADAIAYLQALHQPISSAANVFDKVTGGRGSAPGVPAGSGGPDPLGKMIELKDLE